MTHAAPNQANADPFAQHGIKYLSASSINKFERSKTEWVLANLFPRVKGEKGPAFFARGTAIEDGINEYFNSRNKLEAQAAMWSSFIKQLDRVDDSLSNRQQQARNMVFMLEQAIKVVDTMPAIMPPPAGQHQWGVEFAVPGIGPRFRGMLDYRFDAPNLVVDLKTKNQMPAHALPEDIRQMAIYQQGMPQAYMAILTVSTQQAKLVQLTDTEIKAAWQDVLNITAKMSAFLAQSTNRDTLLKLAMADDAKNGITPRLPKTMPVGTSVKLPAASNSNKPQP